jgi:tellurite resistance protein TerB
MAAVSAACAMVAFADGVVRPEEMAKLIEYLRIDETLKVFDPVEVIGEFERFVEALAFDAGIGREKAFSAVGRIAPRSDEAKLIVLIACAVGGADEDFNNDQRLMVRHICKRLGFDPREFDLNLRAPSLADLPKPLPGVSGGHPPNRSPKIRRKDVNMPDWMRHPPDPAPRSAAERDGDRESHGRGQADESLPEWMHNPLEAPSKKRPASPSERSSINQNDAVPEWMQRPPEPPTKPSAKEAADTDIPDWMKKT